LQGLMTHNKIYTNSLIFIYSYKLLYSNQNFLVYQLI